MRGVAVVAAVALVAFLGWPYAFTVVPIDGEGPHAGAFDPVTYVDEAWGRITATIEEQAVDVADILGALELDPDGRVSMDELVPVTEQFGQITVGGAHIYMVRLTGTVIGVDSEGRRGTMTVAVEGYDGPVAVNVYIGPSLPSDFSVRDAVGFIHFGDFRDQTEFGMVAAEINRRISQSLAELDREDLHDKRVTVLGAMTIQTFNLVQIDLRGVFVVPVSIEVP
jgi:predicted lipoprotein